MRLDWALVAKKCLVCWAPLREEVVGPSEIRYRSYANLPVRTLRTKWFPRVYIDNSDKIEKVGGACGSYVGEERRIQGFGGESWGKETTWETQA